MNHSRLQFAVLVTATAALFAATHSCAPSPTQHITNATAIDGDTFRIPGDRVHFRLAAIDAPELPGHCRVGRHCVAGNPYAARSALQSYLDQGVECTGASFDRYHRRLVNCTLSKGADIGALLINSGYAKEWPHD